MEQRPRSSTTAAMIHVLLVMTVSRMLTHRLTPRKAEPLRRGNRMKAVFMTPAYAGRCVARQDDEGGVGWTLRGGAGRRGRRVALFSSWPCSARRPQLAGGRLRELVRVPSCRAGRPAQLLARGAVRAGNRRTGGNARLRQRDHPGYPCERVPWPLVNGMIVGVVTAPMRPRAHPSRERRSRSGPAGRWGRRTRPETRSRSAPTRSRAAGVVAGRRGSVRRR